MTEKDSIVESAEARAYMRGCNARVLLTLALALLPYPVFLTYIGESLNKRAGYWLPRDTSHIKGNTSYRVFFPPVEDRGQPVPKHDLYTLERRLELSLLEWPEDAANRYRLYHFAHA